MNYSSEWSQPVVPYNTYYGYWGTPPNYSNALAGPSRSQQLSAHQQAFIFGHAMHPPASHLAPRHWVPAFPPALAPWVPTAEPYHLSPLSISEQLPDVGCMSSLIASILQKARLLTLPRLAVPPSPTDSCASSALAATPPPVANTHLDAVHVVCAVPLLAPRPLPFHSPRFLQFDDLPDQSEDLSHPPYVSRPSKRKHTDDAAREDAHGPSPAKRPMLALPAGKRRGAPQHTRAAPPQAAAYHSHATHGAFFHAQPALLSLRG